MIQSTPPISSREQPQLQPVNSNSICQWLIDLIQSALTWLCCCCYNRTETPTLENRVTPPQNAPVSSQNTTEPVNTRQMARLTGQYALDNLKTHYPQIQQWFDTDRQVCLTINTRARTLCSNLTESQCRISLSGIINDEPPRTTNPIRVTISKLRSTTDTITVNFVWKTDPSPQLCLMDSNGNTLPQNLSNNRTPNPDHRVSTQRTEERHPLTTQASFDNLKAHYPQIQQWFTTDGAVNLSTKHWMRFASQGSSEINAITDDAEGAQEVLCQNACQRIIADFIPHINKPNFEYRISVTVSKVHSRNPADTVTYIWQNDPLPTQPRLQ